jgi:hypothetical protein
MLTLAADHGWITIKGYVPQDHDLLVAPPTDMQIVVLPSPDPAHARSCKAFRR